MAAPIYKGGAPFFKPYLRFPQSVILPLLGSGAPTNGTSGSGAGKAGKGSLYIDYTNGVVYLNVGTKASPTWTPFSSGGSQAGVTALSVNGAIPVRPSTRYAITKAGVLADTLAAPVAGAPGTGDDGVTLTIASTTANLHTVTATGLLQTGSALTDVATFNAFAGASLILMAYNAKWVVIGANGISFS